MGENRSLNNALKKENDFEKLDRHYESSIYNIRENSYLQDQDYEFIKDCNAVIKEMPEEKNYKTILKNSLPDFKPQNEQRIFYACINDNIYPGKKPFESTVPIRYTSYDHGYPFYENKNQKFYRNQLFDKHCFSHKLNTFDDLQKQKNLNGTGMDDKYDMQMIFSKHELDFPKNDIFSNHNKKNSNVLHTLNIKNEYVDFQHKYTHNIHPKMDNHSHHLISYPTKNTFYYNCPSDSVFPSQAKSYNYYINQICKHDPSSIYSDVIYINHYYFLRQRKNLSPIVVKTVDIKDDFYVVKTENNDIIYAKKGELINFDPYNAFFRHLMTIPDFRSDSCIKRVLSILGYNNVDCIMKQEIGKDLFDSDLSEEEFYKVYREYLIKELNEIGDYYEVIGHDKLLFDSDEKKIKSVDSLKRITVPGTKKLTLYSLYSKVCKDGGMDRVTYFQDWKKLFYESICKTNCSYTSRTFYKKRLYEFEIYRKNLNKADHTKYKYNIGDKVYIEVDQIKYYCVVRLQRNRGINQYYVQYYGWPKEFNEWHCEDVLVKYEGNLTNAHKKKRITRSSKANHLIKDPLTWEKHSHNKKSDDKRRQSGVDLSCTKAESDDLHKNYEKEDSCDDKSGSANEGFRSLIETPNGSTDLIIKSENEKSNELTSNETKNDLGKIALLDVKSVQDFIKPESNNKMSFFEENRNDKIEEEQKNNFFDVSERKYSGTINFDHQNKSPDYKNDPSLFLDGKSNVVIASDKISTTIDEVCSEINKQRFRKNSNQDQITYQRSNYENIMQYKNFKHHENIPSEIIHNESTTRSNFNENYATYTDQKKRMNSTDCNKKFYFYRMSYENNSDLNVINEKNPNPTNMYFKTKKICLSPIKNENNNFYYDIEADGYKNCAKYQNNYKISPLHCLKTNLEPINNLESSYCDDLQNSYANLKIINNFKKASYKNDSEYEENRKFFKNNELSLKFDTNEVFDTSNSQKNDTSSDKNIEKHPQERDFDIGKTSNNDFEFHSQRYKPIILDNSKNDLEIESNNTSITYIEKNTENKLLDFSQDPKIHLSLNSQEIQIIHFLDNLNKEFIKNFRNIHFPIKEQIKISNIQKNNKTIEDSSYNLIKTVKEEEDIKTEKMKKREAARISEARLKQKMNRIHEEMCGESKFDSSDTYIKNKRPKNANFKMNMENKPSKGTLRKSKFYKSLFRNGLNEWNYMFGSMYRDIPPK
ncbi:hypothetical protein EDEG_00789 [Edhazardia aedis USNM 41457]|uniref:ARID domain-containing protein n=1 Tax=Edhazardia aedis (strain USNM 41457) TaxID=1003232 RepID=J9DCB0_EDHAE|nr:hypothetical protein EDEG_00789 [Edhazardia aedis USNM 41457]|eukprot:EJW05119.1 hypothetical protein EDEG_00789 [Edhazardia aedis USNM 41457]